MPEQGLLLPMVDQVECNTGSRPQMVLADTNYAAEATFLGLEARGVALGREDKQRAIRSAPVALL